MAGLARKWVRWKAANFVSRCVAAREALVRWLGSPSLNESSRLAVQMRSWREWFWSLRHELQSHYEGSERRHSWRVTITNVKRRTRDVVTDHGFVSTYYTCTTSWRAPGCSVVSYGRLPRRWTLTFFADSESMVYLHYIVQERLRDNCLSVKTD